MLRFVAGASLVVFVGACGGTAGDGGLAGEPENGGNGGGSAMGGSPGIANGATGGTGLGGAAGDPPSMPGPPPALHVEGRNFVDATGRRIILRGVALPDLREMNTERPGMNVREMIYRVSDETDGFYARVVRLTVYPERWLPDPETYLDDDLRPAVEYASARGLYVIVDWHEISDVAPVIQRTAEFWARVAPEFAGQGNVLYELFNEPMEMADPSWARWKDQAQPVVDNIRSVASNVILIGGPYWSQRIEGAAADPFEGPDLAYVGHVYPIIDPGTWAPGGAFDQVSQVHPLFISEWGYRYDGGEIWNATRQTFGDPLRAFIDPRGISWTAWCADNVWAPVMFDSQWSLLSGDREMGGFVKEWLADSRDDLGAEVPGPVSTPTNPEGRCSPATSPAEVSFDGRLMTGRLQLQPRSCLGNLSTSLGTCQLDDGGAPIDCVELSVSVPMAQPPTGMGTYFDAAGREHSLQITGGSIPRDALIEQRPTRMSLTGTLTEAGDSTRPFELTAGGCPEDLRVCLL